MDNIYMIIFALDYLKTSWYSDQYKRRKELNFSKE